jgi:predicted TIM-barrel fold metal-dependent hydrolase
VARRHPGLKIVFTEQRVEWVPQTLRDLDSLYLSDMGPQQTLPKRPSQYWAEHCYLSGSSLAPFEVAVRGQVGLTNLMWGSDYPHTEGTWPYTRLAMRYALCQAPEDDVRHIIGENAIPVYGLDVEALRPVAQRIGPTPEEIATPLEANEFPELRGHAFRQNGAFS